VVTVLLVPVHSLTRRGSHMKFVSARAIQRLEHWFKSSALRLCARCEKQICGVTLRRIFKHPMSWLLTIFTKKSDCVLCWVTFAETRDYVLEGLRSQLPVDWVSNRQQCDCCRSYRTGNDYALNDNNFFRRWRPRTETNLRLTP